MKDDTNDEDPNISDGGTFACHLNDFAHLFIMPSFKISIIFWNHGLESLKLLSLLNFEWDMKLYFLHMKSDEAGTTLKHHETINNTL
jgi:hypothetical protein